MPHNKWFSTDVVFHQQFENIDAESGIIRGVKVVSEGEAKGHGVWLNKKFIREAVSYGKEQTVGVKARFGHPNMCATALGTYIGRYKNYRTSIEENEEWEDGKRYHAIADLYLDETAKNLPKLGNAWQYIINLATTSPDMFGNSIVFTPGQSNFKKIKKDDGTEYQREEATIMALHATDLVDEPAATDGLFSKFEEDDLAMQTTMFLDQHPEIYDLAINHPDIVNSFLTKYESFKKEKQMAEEKKENKKSLKDKILALFESEDTGEKVPTEHEQITALELQIAEKDAKIQELEAAKNPTEVGDAANVEILAAKDTEIDDLKAKLETKEAELKAKETELANVKVDLDKATTQLSQLGAPSTSVAGDEGNLSDDVEEKVLFGEDIKKITKQVNYVPPKAHKSDPEKEK